MKKLTTVATGAAIVASFASGNTMAAENLLGIQQLDSDTHVAMSEGTRGEGKCGDSKNQRR